MPPTCSATCRSDRQLTWPCAAVFAAIVLVGCGQQEGIVGRQLTPDATTNGEIFESEFKTSDGPWLTTTALPGASVTFGNADPSARDGYAAKLVFPGDAALTSTDNVGPDYMTQLQTTERFGFGTLHTRVEFGVVQARKRS